jgi:tRNA nucleotidyltransferase/poly(A) polymerase
MTLGSTSFFRNKAATSFTDGYVHNSDLEFETDNSPVLKCSKCGHLFWFHHVENAYEISEALCLSDRNPRIGFASYVEVCEKKCWTNLYEEKLIRRKFWHLTNNKFRFYNELDYSLSELEIENIKCLIEILREDIFTEALMKAEANRQIGNFEECIRILQSLKIEKIMKAHDKIKKLAEEEDIRVRPI